MIWSWGKRIREEKAKRQEIQKSLLKDLKKRASGYEDVWNSRLTVLGNGRKTGLYKVLRERIGNCG